MTSLSSRLLVSVSVLLLVFFGATIAVLDRAFTEAGEQARRDILDGHLVALLAAAEPDDSGKLAMPERLREPRFQRIGSGLYAELRELDGNVLWRSRSALGMEVPIGTVPELGNHLFGREELEDGTPILTLALTVDYGWLTILSDPLFWLLSKAYGIFGNWGVAIILLTLLAAASIWWWRRHGHVANGPSGAAPSQQQREPDNLERPESETPDA